LGIYKYFRKEIARMLKEFKEFVMRGNVVDMAVGIVIGAAFGVIITSLVKDIIMPPIGLLIGDDFSNLFAVIKEGDPAGPYATLALAKEAGAVTINWGVFVLAIISFIIIAIAVFLLIRSINKMRRNAEEAPLDTKDCPYCLSKIAIEAKRCAYCTSEL
jgi:large conductance mechanosensitive channel